MASGGKGARARNKEARKKKKQAEKAAKKALYASYALRGDNSKRKQRSQKKRYLVSTTKHKSSNCGNQGCKRCHPYNFHAWMVNGVFTGAPQKVYEAYLRSL